MIAFGASIPGADAYRHFAEPGIRRAAEPDSEVLAFAAVEPTARAYNLILDAAARLPGIEALVLVHPHAEILDQDFCDKVRGALRDPDVAIVGSAGASGVRGIAWWEGTVVSAPARHCYEEFGGGELRAFSWASPAPPPAEVQTVDSQLLVLSPWAVRELRFDEGLVLNYGFELDFCLQAGAAGKKLLVADLRVNYHRPLELVPNLDVWVEAQLDIAERWDQLLRPMDDGDEDAWKRRARYAEADREAARATAFSTGLKLDVRVLELEQELAEKTNTISWRLTAPLRALNRARAEKRRQAAG
jgi:hypothetical protein